MMATYTDVDIDNSVKFAQANLNYRILHKLHEVAPHLSSWLDVKEKTATCNDFYIPSTLMDSAKIVNIEIGETLCNLLSCMPIKETLYCNPHEKASYYHIYSEIPSFDDPKSTFYDVQCQPSCFNTSHKATFNKDMSREPDTPLLRWNNLKCHKLNTEIIAYLEKPRWRSEKMWEMRVNNMKMGFTRIKSSETLSGITYRMNAEYCTVFDKHYDEKEKTCYMTAGEKIFDALIGMTIANNVLSFHRTLTSYDRLPFENPTNLPNLPTTLDVVHTLEGWKENVKKEFKLPELIDTKPKPFNVTHCAYKMQDNVDELIRKRRETEIEINNTPSKKEKNEPIDKKDWVDKTKDIIINLLRSFTESQTYIDMAIEKTATIFLVRFKCLMIKTIERLALFLGKGLIGITKSIGQRVVFSAIQGLALKVAVKTLIGLGTRLAIASVALVSGVASIIGFLMLISIVFEIGLSIWDPHKYNGIFPPEYPNDLMHRGEIAMKKATGTAIPTYSFEELAETVLGKDVLLDIYVESIIDQIRYLNELRTNSDGSIIDQGKLLDVSVISFDGIEEISAENVKFTPQILETYNERFMNRYLINKYINYISGLSIIASGTFFILHLPILSILCILCSVIILALARLQLQNNFIIDIIEHCKDKNLFLQTE